MLGFGASGTAAALYQDKIEKYYYSFLAISAVLFPVFLAAGFYTSAYLEFNPYEMALDALQAINLFLYFFLMGIPFFFGASIIFIAMIRNHIPTAYFFNLTGSGAGAIAAMGALFLFHPYDIMILIIFISFIPVFILSSLSGKKNFTAGFIMITITAAASVYLLSKPEFKKISQYKSISGALNLPEARIVKSMYSPLSVVHVVEADGLRSTAGLSMASPYNVPIQKGIFFDGDSMSSITPYEGDIYKVRYIEYLASYLPFYLHKNHHNGRLLIIGSGGGESILKSILADFKEVHAVEVNSNVISIMKKDFAAFSGNIYNRKNLTIYNSDGRSFVKQCPGKYDLIEISLLDAYNTSASGVYALNETYLYTTGSFQDYYSCLSGNGILSVTRWITTPPRDSLKLFSTVIESLRIMNIENIENHLAVIRSLQTVTLLVSKSPFTDLQITNLKKFCGDRYFDIIFCPGLKRMGTNRYIKLSEPVYYDSIMKLLSDDRQKFIKEYDFDITAPSDDRPYFYNFFKPQLIGYIKKYGASQVPVTEWGYLILLIILLPVIIISFICIILPVLKVKAISHKPDTILFFSLIATGYFFIEMPLIQKLVLFLGHPSYSISVIISGLLIFSGMGSYFSDRIFSEKFRIIIPAMLIAALIMLYQNILDSVLSELVTMHIAAKIMFVFLLIAPPAFFMGFPFAQGLVQMKKINIILLPLAWGVNGFFSVISVITAALFSINFGFRTVFISAAVCYILAGVISLNFNRHHQ
jgi:spermidine synthase